MVAVTRARVHTMLFNRCGPNVQSLVATFWDRHTNRCDAHTVGEDSVQTHRLLSGFCLSTCAKSPTHSANICTVIQQYLWTLKLLPILLQGFESEMRAGSLKVAAAFVSVVQRDAAMAEFSL
jgi:hypothetical protein